MWRYTITALIRASDVQFGKLRDEYRVRIRVTAKNRLEARRKAMEIVWKAKMLVSRFVGCQAKRRRSK